MYLNVVELLIKLSSGMNVWKLFRNTVDDYTGGNSNITPVRLTCILPRCDTQPMEINNYCKINWILKDTLSNFGQSIPVYFTV